MIATSGFVAVYSAPNLFSALPRLPTSKGKGRGGERKGGDALTQIPGSAAVFLHKLQLHPEAR